MLCDSHSLKDEDFLTAEIKCVCVCVCVRACVCACVRACMHASERERERVSECNFTPYYSLLIFCKVPQTRLDLALYQIKYYYFIIISMF